MVKVYLESNKNQIVRTQTLITESKDELYKTIKDYYIIKLDKIVEIELIGTLDNSFIIKVTDRSNTINDRYLLTVKSNSMVA